MEKINVAELLKDCPKGMELDCTILNDVTLDSVDIDGTYPIIIATKSGYLTSLTKYGQQVDIEDAKCVIFPKGKTTWEGFVPPCKFKDGDIVTWKDRGSLIAFIYKERKNIAVVKYHFALYTGSLGTFTDGEIALVESELVFATEEEKQKLFKTIKEHGYKWNAETKTLEKLPKFKEGDRIRGKYTNNIYTISSITPTGYKLTNGTSFDFNNEDCYELVLDKFDIATLKPFSEVLVRYDNDNPWMIAHFSHYMKDAEWKYPYFASGACFKQCIPYKGNEHLRGTKNDCDDFYKTWK